MPYKYILFDLDGTLTDPHEGITKSVAYALRHYGIEPPPLHKLFPFIGPPLADSFMEFYGFDSEKAAEAVEVYREYFTVKGKYENIVYDGIKQLLAALRADGRVLAVATSKPEVLARDILEHFELADSFDIIRGSMMDGTRVKKHEVIQAVLEELQPQSMDDVVMVGDRKFDVAGAKEFGMDCIGVLFGFGSREELESAGAKYIAQNVTELGKLLGVSVI